MSEELKPCQCGGTGHTSTYTVGPTLAHALTDWHSVICGACGYSTATFPTKAEAIAAWNTRATPAGVTATEQQAIHQYRISTGHPWTDCVNVQWAREQGFEVRTLYTSPAVGQDDARELTPPYTCKFCGERSWVGPDSQWAPPDQCHNVDHGAPEPFFNKLNRVPSLREALEAIASGEGDAQLIAQQTLDLHDAMSTAPASEPVTEVFATDARLTAADLIVRDVAELDYSGFTRPDELMHVTTDDLLTIVRRHTCTAPTKAEPVTSEGGSIETPEFRDLIDAMLNEYWEPEQHRVALIAHFDARIAAASLASYRNGFEQGRAYGEMGAAQAGSELPELNSDLVNALINIREGKDPLFEKATVEIQAYARAALAKQSREDGA